MPDRELPDGWRVVRLSDVASVETGGTPSRARPEFWGGVVNWMSSGEVNQRRVACTAERITEAGLASSNAKLFPPGTLMLAMNGQGRTRGKVAVLEVEAACNQSLAAIRGQKEADSRFLLHNLDSRYGELRRLTGGDGRNGLNLGLLRSLRVMLPPPDEQARIADVLDAIDDAIEKTEAVIEATERLRAALLGELLTRGVPGWHTEWKQVPGIGTIPACWEVVRLGEVLESSVYGPRFPATLYDDAGNVATLRTTDLDEDGTVNLGTMPTARLAIEGFNQFLLKKSDLVITRSGSCGIAAIFEGFSMPVLPGAFLIRMRPRRSADSPYLKLWLNSKGGRGATKRLEAGGVQKNLNAQNLGRLRLPLPPREERDVITSAAALIGTRAQQEHITLQALRGAKTSAADALLSGRVRVPNAAGKA